MIHFLLLPCGQTGRTSVEIKKGIQIFSLLGLMVLLSLNAYSTGTIVLEGNYQGKNLYVQNPFASAGVGFCVFEVRVNGEVSTDEVQSSAFEIDFTQRQLEVGEKVVVTIRHKDGCRPKVLNPEVLKPKSTFETVSINIDPEGVLRWSTEGETGKLPYIIEQYRWNKWIKVGEVDGVGTPGKNEYNFKIATHSGENKFRVKQVDYTGKPRYSKAASHQSSEEEVTFSPKKAKNELFFTRETMFEIYDSYGNIVKKGFSEKVDVSNLKKDIYYINYDNKMDSFVKK